MSTLTLPATFTATRYRLKLRAVETLSLPRLKGNTLRGGFGLALKRQACLNYAVCKDSTFCLIGNDCPYGYIFESSPHRGEKGLSNIENIPPPYIIEADHETRPVFERGETMAFDLILVGRANEYSQTIRQAFERLGRETGLGANNGKYTLLSMEPIKVWAAAQLMAQVQSMDSHQLALEFVTATKFKHNNQWVNSGPPFQALVKALVSRTSSLSRFHCGLEWAIDFRGVIDRAVQVEIIKTETYWENQTRYSTRQERGVSLGGLKGRVIYSGPFQEYLPLIALGELIHVGKAAVLGNGQYRIVNP